MWQVRDRGQVVHIIRELHRRPFWIVRVQVNNLSHCTDIHVLFNVVENQWDCAEELESLWIVLAHKLNHGKAVNQMRGASIGHARIGLGNAVKAL